MYYSNGFSDRVEQRWNNLSQEDVDQTTLNGFKEPWRKGERSVCESALLEKLMSPACALTIPSTFASVFEH